MKQKFTFIVLFAFLSLGINAQTLNNWTIATADVTVEQETDATYVSEGTYAAKVTWTSTSNQDVNSDAFNVTGDASYTYSLDVYDNTDAGRVRMVLVFDDGTYVYSNVYSEDQASVQTLTITGTVPTSATTAFIRLRFYDESAGWAGSATVWVDNANYNEGGSNLVTNGGFESWAAAPTGPVISDIAATPWSPTSSETVNVSATITDDVSVAGATLYWSLTSPVTNADNSITMTASGDVYTTSAAIPAQTDGTIVYYIIGAVDNDLNVETSDEQSYTVVDPVAHTISEIQTPDDISVSDASPYTDEKITTTGIVYATASYGYYIQDGDGAWNGILVYDNQNTPAQGDEVTISGFVKEYYNLTEISPVSAFAVNSSGNTLPSATVVTTADAANEDYEGVLVQVRGASCTNEDAGYGQWEVDDGSGALLIDDDMFSYTPTANVKYNVTGPRTYSFSAAKILPRDADDVQDATAISDVIKNAVSVYPNPSNGVLNVTADGYALEVFDITGRVVTTRTLNGTASIELPVSGVYFLRFSNDKGSFTQKVIVK